MFWAYERKKGVRMEVVVKGLVTGWNTHHLTHTTLAANQHELIKLMDEVIN